MNSTSQKAHDIAFATFRVAALVGHRKLREELQNSAVELAVNYEAVANPALAKSATVISILERLITLGESIKEIGPISARVLKRELGNLQTAIKEANAAIQVATSGKKEPQEANLDDIFGSSGNLNGNPPAGGEAKKSEETKEANTASLEATKEALSSVSERQMAILESIRQNEFCRLRNIVDDVDGVSPRTIRNDIQDLINMGLVRRVGNGGPASYFQLTGIKTSSTAQL